ncbi:phage scaffolding protein [Companilactobacillus mishanensis]|nr:phage scaffolding protein [Companilactobacillus mishanensis]
MERKDLKGLELSDDQITGVLKLYNQDLDPLKASLQTAETERDTFKESVTDRDNQLADLQKQVGDNEELKSQIEELQSTNKKSSSEFQDQIATMKRDGAIKLALRDSKAKDADMVFKSLDLNDVTLNDKGKLSGLSDQLEEFKKSHDYMFEAEPEQKKEPINAFIDGNPSGAQGDKDSLVSKIASRMAKAK